MRLVRPARHGLAFGIRAAAMPGTFLVAVLGTHMVAATGAGWGASYAAAAGAGVFLVAISH